MNPENKIEDKDSADECKQPDNESEDIDDGFSKSDDDECSFHSAGETLADFKSSASSTSGLASTTSSKSSLMGHISEIIQKFHISREANDAIFKPDYRLSVTFNGEPKYWHEQNYDDIDFLKEHTKEDDLFEPKKEEFTSKYIRAQGKIFVRASLEKHVIPYAGPVVKIHVRNDRLNVPVTLLDLLWINMYDHEIETMDNVSQPITLSKNESIDFKIPVNKFELSKSYKLVIYYGPLDLLFSKEFLVKVTTRPISTMYLEKMDHYFPEPTVRELDRCNYKVPKHRSASDEVKILKERILTYEKSESASRLTSSNYYSMYKLLLQMEDETDSKRSLRHDQFNQRVRHLFGKRYSLQINNKRLEAAINEYTRIWIAPMSLRTAEARLNEIQFQRQKIARRNGEQPEPVQKHKKQRIYGSVVEIKGNNVLFELNDSLDRFVRQTNVLPADEEYFIRFMSDRTTITLEHRALEYLNNQDIAHFFFPSLSMASLWPSNKTHPSSYSADRSIEWSSEDINDEQKSAVINILKQTSYPYPYLLFGPPGTGKTKTLIEAILHLIHNDNPDESILVCATSNSACNEVAQRLLGHCGSDKVFRIFSKSMALKKSEIPNDVLSASNLQTGEHYYPSLQVIYRYKVIVCTLTIAGRLSQGKIDPKHFSHIFIDEAGSATETQTIIAVAGLCSTKNEIHANLIFAGDPKQLGPLIKSQQAIKMGYGVSMLERLITTNSMYMRNETTKMFNENYVTQLICNYRSHSSILHSSNKLYYDDALRVCAPKENTNWFLDTSILKEPKFPVIFHSVKGITVRDKSNPSSYNKLEIETTLAYLRKIFRMPDRKIEQCDIGIISPYRRQCDALIEQCALNGYKDVQIGSVEIFQGKEKPIIIVSTVRSQMNNIGFLDSKKRLNVLLTRAKCLLIIIGDADTLATDEDWGYVIQFCKANNSLIE